LRFSLKLKAGVASAAAAVTLMAVGASAASAVPASWVSGGQAKLSGTLTVTNGGQSITCPINPNHIYSAGNLAGPPVQGRLGGAINDPTGRSYCSNGNGLTLLFGPTSYANKSGSAFSIAVVPGAISYAFDPFDPWSVYGYTQVAYTVAFVNGTVSTPSKLTYSNTYIGGGMSATGVINVTKLDGSLLKLQ
jgi:hypothetical protein